ncbi:MAG: hypothetical protein H7Z21_03775 [Hymenobacter sp.]|nr:hypothetical protein [Hymenobacter sp.]
MNLHNPATDLPAANSLPVPAPAEGIGTPAQRAFREAVEQVEGLRQRLRELEVEQAEARRRYWQQVGPGARAVVEARRALFGPLEEALLLGYFSRAEESQITEFITANARALQNRFGEDAADILRKYAPRRAAETEAEAETEAAPAAKATDFVPDPASEVPPHEQAAAQARVRRKTKAQKAQEVAAKTAREEQQRLLANTKNLYRQLARTHHPDLERDPAAQQHKTALMQRITEAYETNDLYTLLQLLAESSAASADDDVLTRYTQALHQQQLELKQRLNELKYGENGFSGSSGKKRETELRQLKRHLRDEAAYLTHILRLMREPEGLREVLRELTATGHDTV